MIAYWRLPLSSLAVLGLVCNGHPALAQERDAKPRATAAKTVIRKQAPPKIDERRMAEATQENTSVLVVLSKQRAYLLVNGETALDTPISSGKRSGMTPTGRFQITEKDADHASNIYGNFVDRRGRVVRAGVSTRIDSAPSGTRFVGAPMKWFMRFSGAVGMHVGILPGYPASHGCVRLPAEIAPRIYSKVKVGTVVEVLP